MTEEREIKPPNPYTELAANGKPGDLLPLPVFSIEGEKAKKSLQRAQNNMAEALRERGLSYEWRTMPGKNGGIPHVLVLAPLPRVQVYRGGGTESNRRKH